MVCIYCGKSCEFWCRDCGEAHLVTEAEFDEYHADPAPAALPPQPEAQP